MAQLNVEINDGLYKKVKMACVEEGINIKKWVGTALELMLDFDELAMARCKELGWAPGPDEFINIHGVEVVEILEDPPPSKKGPKRVQQT